VVGEDLVDEADQRPLVLGQLEIHGGLPGSWCRVMS
jgi:hypothetical protein